MQLNTHSSIENNTSLTSQSFGLEQTPFFFKILSSSLYERKEEAVLRELSANALDAHNMSGKKDTPIEIILPNELSPELVVKDYGHGMSLLELENIYTVYGSSTKRTDNTNIGGFGMGSKSPFALSDSFTVESTHEGITTNIACYLDEGHPKFSVFSSTRTNAPSGTTVKVPVSNKENQRNLVQASGLIFFFWEVQPQIKGAKVTENLSRYMEHQDDTVTVLNRNAPIVPWSSGSVLDHVSIGPFYYSLPSNLKGRINGTKEAKEIYSLTLNKRNLSYVLKFDIGELELSPSRERIEDTQENYELILSRLSDLIKNIKGDLKESVTRIYYNLYKLFLEKGRKSTDYKLCTEEKIIGIDKELINKFFSEKLSTSSNPLTTSYLMSKVLNNASETFKQSLELNDSEFSELVNLGKSISNILTTTGVVYDLTSSNADERFLDLNTIRNYSVQITVLSKFIPDNAEQSYISNIFVNKLSSYIIDTTSNGAFKHTNIKYAHDVSVHYTNSNSFFIIKGYRESQTTKLINQTIKHSLIGCPDPSQNTVLVVYTADHSVSDVAHDIALLKNEKELQYFTLEDLEKVKNDIPKTVRTKSSTTVKKAVPHADKEVATVLLPKPDKNILRVMDLYDPEFYSKYDHLIVTSANCDVIDSNLPDHITEKLLSGVLVLKLINNSERNTARFKNIENHFESKNKTFSYCSNSELYLRTALETIIKTSQLKCHKEVIIEVIKPLFFIDYLYNIPLFKLDTRSVHKHIFNVDLYTDNKVKLDSLPYYHYNANLHKRAYSYFQSLLSTRVKYLYNSIIEDACNTSVEYNTLRSDLPEIFTKKELAMLRKAYSKTIKKLGELYDSTFKDVIYSNSNTQ